MYAEIQYSSNIENFERAKGTVVGDSRVHLNCIMLRCSALQGTGIPLNAWNWTHQLQQCTVLGGMLF